MRIFKEGTQLTSSDPIEIIIRDAYKRGERIKVMIHIALIIYPRSNKIFVNAFYEHQTTDAKIHKISWNQGLSYWLTSAYAINNNEWCRKAKVTANPD